MNFAWIYHDGSWTEPELMRLHAGEVVDRNGKRFRACGECAKVIRIDRPIWGSMHICVEAE